MLSVNDSAQCIVNMFHKSMVVFTVITVLPGSLGHDRLISGVQAVNLQYSGSELCRDTKASPSKKVIFLSNQSSEHLIVKIITLMTSIL